MSAELLAIIVAALAGALTGYLYHATRPAAYDEPRYRYPMGVRIEQVSGAGARPRVLVAAGALVACLVFLAGSLATLL